MLKGPQSCIASYKLEDLRNNTVTSQHGGLILDCHLYFSLDRRNSDVCKQATSLLPLVNTCSSHRNYCEEPRCPKSPKFPSFLVSVSFIWLIEHSETLLIELTERNTQRHLCDQRTSYDEQPAPPQIKDRVFFVLLGGDWGEGTRKRAVTDGKGSHAHCSICRAQSY